MFLRIYFFFIFFLYSSYVFSQNAILQNDKSNSRISYELRHPAHDVVGVSEELEVKIELNRNNYSIINAIAQVRVASFNSGNSNRDSEAMNLIEAIKYPYARFRSTSIRDFGDTLTIYGDLTFHGITKNITIKGNKKISGSKLIISGNFAISLDSFNVKRPTLLFIPSEEYLRFSFKCEFTIN
ncbi:MAG: YceI family protein [Ignavibacteria bacterium]|nr:YceI family protein [Ignavibacteria bacterium]